MNLLKDEIFICIDCESTGLDTKNDKIIEIAVCKFTLDKVISSFDTLVDPKCEISNASQAIHNISLDMVKGQPQVKDILPTILQLVNNHIIVGHGIGFDIDLITHEAQRSNIPSSISTNTYIDTLRLARLYGESPSNSLEALRRHFNIPAQGAHRAKSDVIVNIELFKILSKSYKTTKEILEKLNKPILLKTMPLGKYKGRKFGEIPFEYLQWIATKGNFDQDLLHSIKVEIKSRKKNDKFNQSSNPFSCL